MKPRLSPARIQAMAQARWNAQPAVQSVIAANPKAVPVVGMPRAHERDARGRAWDIVDLEGGNPLDRSFRTIVDSLRDAYDLA